MAAEGEHGQGDEGFGVAEAERDAGQEPDLGVGGLDQGVGQAVVEGGVDGFAVFDDPALQLDEGRDAAAAGPADPGVQGLLAGLAFDRNTMPQAFLE